MSTRCNVICVSTGRPCKNSANCHVHHKQGKGIKEIAQKLLNYLPTGIPQRLYYMSQGPRKGPTKRFTQFLDTTGSQEVVSIEACRKPVEKGVKLAMDALSSGRFSAKAKELGYDDVLHAYLIVTLKDGSSHVIHKNHVVETRPATAADLSTEHYPIPLPAGRKLTLKEMINTAATTDRGAPASPDSQRRFYQYDSAQDNCQSFVRSVIEDNGLTPTDPKAIELLNPQDGQALVATLERYSHLPKLITWRWNSG